MKTQSMDPFTQKDEEIKREIKREAWEILEDLGKLDGCGCVSSLIFICVILSVILSVIQRLFL